MLLLIVGPPGAGKDTLLNLLRRQPEAQASFRFARRVSTRPPGPGCAEDYEFQEEKAFLARRDAGGFLASWRGNGVWYGVPGPLGEDPRPLVANVARAALGELASRHPARVVEITAPADTLARRLAAAGRGEAVDMARRLSRNFALPPGLAKEVVANDGAPEGGARKLLAALRAGAAALAATKAVPALRDWTPE